MIQLTLLAGPHIFVLPSGENKFVRLDDGYEWMVIHFNVALQYGRVLRIADNGNQALIRIYFPDQVTASRVVK